MNYSPYLRVGVLLPRACIAFLCLLFSGASVFASTTDHSKLEELDREFKTGPEVTRPVSLVIPKLQAVAQDQALEVEFLNPDSKQRLGKKNVLNNFCITPPI